MQVYIVVISQKYFLVFDIANEISFKSFCVLYLVYIACKINPHNFISLTCRLPKWDISFRNYNSPLIEIKYKQQYSSQIMSRRGSISDFGSRVMSLGMKDKKKSRKSNTNGGLGNPWQGFITNRVSRGKDQSSSGLNVRICLIYFIVLLCDVHPYKTHKEQVICKLVAGATVNLCRNLKSRK